MFLKELSRKPIQLFRQLGFREQLTFLLILILGFSLIFYSVVLYRNFIQVHEREFDSALYNYTIDVASALNVNLFGEIFISDGVFQANEKIFPFALDKTLLQLRSSTGKSVAQSKELAGSEIPLSEEGLTSINENKIYFYDQLIRVHDHLSQFRVAAYTIDKPGSPRYIIQVASPMILLEKEKRALLAFFLLSIPATLIIAGIVGYYFSAGATAPINKIIKKANLITVHDLNDRLPVPKVEDEIQRLALTLNQLLDRLQDSFKSQENFVSDASHQIKTPLAILRGEIDLMKKENRTPDEIKTFLESASQEVAHLSRTVEELLILARVGIGNFTQLFREVRLDEIAIGVVSRMQKHALAKQKDIKLLFNLLGSEKGEYLILADFDLIRTLMDNLIDNAIKYSFEKKTILIELSHRDQEIEFRVTDQGESFTSEEAEKLSNRFYRGMNTAQNPQVKGSGLGLSIVKKIANLHQARFEIKGNPGVGSQFSVFFPRPFS